jgi:16S rRNA C967 or C1407 C5-methylase (RsmB/RsmF family)/NOL1/NOP2/fmu family ribosome biogenesis protein
LKTQIFPEEFRKHIEVLLKNETPLFYKSLGENPPVSVRNNPFKCSRKWITAIPIPWCENGYYLNERPSFTTDPFFHAGCYYVQEAASMFLEMFINENIGKSQPITALDLCAAPGGKATHLISLLHKESAIFCNEIVYKRNAVLCENLCKWGASNVIVTQNSAQDYSALKSYFDLIVVDAPCSGEGMFRKDPQTIAEWNRKNVEMCALRQTEMLKNIHRSLKQGGILIYATCTYQTAENERQVEWLCRHLGFSEIKIQGQLPEGIVESEYGYRFYPHRVKSEGFYIACLRNNAHMHIAALPYKSLKKQLKHLAFKQVPFSVADMVSEAENYGWFIFKNQYGFVPTRLLAHLSLAEKVLTLRQVGTAVGEEKAKDFLPHPAAALSISRNKNLPKVMLEKDDALLYLKGESLHKKTSKGWLAVMFDEACLGWVKSTGERLNNYYPKMWKIKKEIARFA